MIDRFITLFMGTSFLLIGMDSILMALLGDALIEGSQIGEEWWLLLFFGLGFFVSGLAILKVKIPWLERRERVRDWEAFWGGVIVCLAGLMLMVISFADSRDEAFHASRLVVTLAGATFFLVGLLPLLSALRYDTGPLISLLAALLLTCFGGVAATVVLGPGNLDWFGRLVFAPGALLLLGFAARQWYGLIVSTSPLEHTMSSNDPSEKSTGLPPELLGRLYRTLAACRAFKDTTSLRSIFADQRLAPWRDALPEVQSVEERVRQVIERFHDQANLRGESALLLLVCVLRDQTHRGDGLREELTALTKALARDHPASSLPTNPPAVSHTHRSKRQVILFWLLVGFSGLVIGGIGWSILFDTLGPQPLLLDTREAQDDGAIGPITTPDPLVNSSSYTLTISGTWSAWPANWWNEVCEEKAEPYPQTPSKNGSNSKVGLDAAFIFASPKRATVCGESKPKGFPLPLQEQFSVQLSLDGGNSWVRFVPDTPQVYNPSHVYTATINGQGFPLQLRILDSPTTNDNYGVLTIDLGEN